MSRSLCLALLSFGLASPAMAQEWRTGYTIFGTPGVIEMPSAVAPNDADLAVTFGGFENQQRTSFTFQVLPRLTGTFRYSRIDEYQGPGTDPTFDRSFDFQYQVFEEGEIMPAVAVGLRDFLGTGLLTGEYVVATKTFGPNFRASAGLGWGRLGSYNGFTNPLGVFSDAFETRPAYSAGKGGTPAYNQFFRGDAAVFGGLEWNVSDKVTLLAEYSSDAYVRETNKGVMEFNSPLNFGITYRPNNLINLSAYYMRGSDIGISANVNFNPTRRPAIGGFDRAPIPVRVRPSDLRNAASWDGQPQSDGAVIQRVGEVMALDGFILRQIDLQDRTARVRYTNEGFRAEAQGVGRLSRILTQTLPPSVELFVLEPMQEGIPLSSVTVRRSDLEALENTSDAAWRIFSRSRIDEATSDAGFVSIPDPRPAFEWGISPFAEFQLFDGDKPIRGDYGIQGRFEYQISPNITVDGTLRYRIAGDRNEGAISPANVHPVRRNTSLYGEPGTLGLEQLRLHWYARPAEELYSRVTFGYLERMYAGVSTEVLWKPVDSRLAVGAEVNYVVQRAYDLGLGAQNFPSLGGHYDTVTGHISGYYDFENGFHARVDAGRYLAGDWGATFALDREFENGWRIGAYATLTDISFEDFGEGSFDKGITLTMPTDWALGRAGRDQTDINLNSLTRDGGARVNIDGRLYDIVRDGHEPALTDSWGRFWR